MESRGYAFGVRGINLSNPHTATCRASPPTGAAVLGCPGQLKSTCLLPKSYNLSESNITSWKQGFKHLWEVHHGQSWDSHLVQTTILSHNVHACCTEVTGIQQMLNIWKLDLWIYERRLSTLFETEPLCRLPVWAMPTQPGSFQRLSCLPSHFPLGFLGLWMHTATSGFTRGLKVQTQVLMLVWQEFYLLYTFSAPDQYWILD